eukprot:831081-Karenia_brevis.AAC.1
MRLDEQEQLKFVDLRPKSKVTKTPKISKDLRTEQSLSKVTKTKPSSSTEGRKLEFEDSNDPLYEQTDAENDEIDELLG